MDGQPVRWGSAWMDLWGMNLWRGSVDGSGARAPSQHKWGVWEPLPSGMLHNALPQTKQLLFTHLPP